MLDFSAGNPELPSDYLDNTEAFTRYISRLLENAGAKFGIGGYAEQRAIYSQSKVFDAVTETGEPRRHHLGMDIWGKPHTTAYTPDEAGETPAPLGVTSNSMAVKMRVISSAEISWNATAIRTPARSRAYWMKSSETSIPTPARRQAARADRQGAGARRCSSARAGDGPGSAAYEAGDFRGAARYWQQLLVQLPADSSERAQLAAAIARAEQRARFSLPAS